MYNFLDTLDAFFITGKGADMKAVLIMLVTYGIVYAWGFIHGDNNRIKIRQLLWDIRVLCLLSPKSNMEDKIKDYEGRLDTKDDMVREVLE